MKWRAELILFIRSLLIVSIILNYFSSSIGIIALANGEVLSESTIFPGWSICPNRAQKNRQNAPLLKPLQCDIITVSR